MFIRGLEKRTSEDNDDNRNNDDDNNDNDNRRNNKKNKDNDNDADEEEEEISMSVRALLPPPNVTFSLNKKKRWELLDELPSTTFCRNKSRAQSSTYNQSYVENDVIKNHRDAEFFVTLPSAAKPRHRSCGCPSCVNREMETINRQRVRSELVNTQLNVKK